MAFPIGNSNTGVHSTERKSQAAGPAKTAKASRGRAQTGPTDRVGRLTGRESEASSTPNFSAWDKAKRPAISEAPGEAKGPEPAKQEKQLRLPEGMLLSDGSRGSKVKGLQYMLNKHGEELKKDGIFGPKTLEAVRKLQQEHGLKVDGIVGPKTLKVLNNTPRPESKGEGKPGSKPEQKPANNTQPKPEQKPANNTQPKPEQKPTNNTQPQPEQRPPQARSEQPKPEVKPEAQNQPAKPEFGLSPKTLAAMTRSGNLEIFRKLPPEVSGRYEQLSPKMRQSMFTQLNGSTWGNSHREAFIKGSVMGMDTFSIMSDKVQTAVSNGELSRKEGDALRGDFQRLSRLTPRERQAIAEMFMLQGGK